MKKAAVGLVLAILGLVPPAIAQTTSETLSPVSIWSVHSPDIVVARRKLYPLAVFTPPGPIVVLRVEALSNRGPLKGFFSNGDPVACPVQYTIEISNGVTKQQIPISNAFLNKDTSQTYTDSGPLRLLFSGQNRITVSLLPPAKQEYPPVSCSMEGFNITIQYQATEAAGSSSDRQ